MATVTVTAKNVEDMVDMAAYGIAYWAVSPTPELCVWEAAKEQGALIAIAPHPEYVGSPVGHGSQELIKPVYYLSEADLVAAFWKLVENEPKVVGGMVHGYFQNAVKNATPEDGVDSGWIDSTAADCLVQVAAFGHVVFG